MAAAADIGGVSPPRVLLIPGWNNSGPRHWQSLWNESRTDTIRLEQDNWAEPDLPSWLAVFQNTVVKLPAPVIVAAHSLGCILLVQALRRITPKAILADKIAGALLVAPADVDSAFHTPACLRGFGPIPLEPLPLNSTVVMSQNDPHLSPARGRYLARCWESHLVDIGYAGHINAESGYGAWPDGERLLERLLPPVHHARAASG